MFTALSLMVLGYLIPFLVRRREVLAESRVSDRFSQHLRLVDPAEPPHTEAAHRSETRVLVHGPEVSRRRTEALAMIRPTAPAANRVNARELALARAARAGSLSRRAAAARRRRTLSATVAVAALAIWAAVALGALAWGWTLLPTAALGGVVYVGRRAALVAAQQDARDRAEMARLDQRLRLCRDEARAPGPKPAQPAVAPDAEPAQVEPAAPVDFADLMEGDAPAVAEEPRHARRPAVADSSWTPRAVPLPTYTLKQEAPRRNAEPFVAAAFNDAGVRVPVRPTATAPTSSAGDEAEAAEEAPAPAFDLNSVLARRRAVGG